MNPEAEPQSSLRERAYQVVRRVSALGKGDRTQLRREGIALSVSPAFFKIAIEVLEPLGLLPPEGDRRRDAAEDRWSLLLAAFVLLEGRHSRGRSLGAALAESGLTELRLERLLRADTSTLPKILVSALHQLSHSGTLVDLGELTLLLLVDSPEYRESIRRQVARSYYRTTERKNEAPHE